MRLTPLASRSESVSKTLSRLSRGPYLEGQNRHKMVQVPPDVIFDLLEALSEWLRSWCCARAQISVSFFFSTLPSEKRSWSSGYGRLPSDGPGPGINGVVGREMV